MCVSWTSHPPPLMWSSVLLLQQTSVLSMTSLLLTKSVKFNLRMFCAKRLSSGETHTLMHTYTPLAVNEKSCSFARILLLPVSNVHIVHWSFFLIEVNLVEQVLLVKLI